MMISYTWKIILKTEPSKRNTCNYWKNQWLYLMKNIVLNGMNNEFIVYHPFGVQILLNQMWL